MRASDSAVSDGARRRLLFVSDVPVISALGAGQVIANLVDALNARHDVEIWTPPRNSTPGSGPLGWARLRHSIVEYVRSQTGTFDAVDVPPVGSSQHLSRLVPIVIRSRQPDIQYHWLTLRSAMRGLPTSAPALLRAISASMGLLSLRSSWKHASTIACQGSMEIQWMKRYFPETAPRLTVLPSCPSPSLQEALSVSRRRRIQSPKPSQPGTVRYLWLGRWTAHKGVDVLPAFLRERLQANESEAFTIAGCGEAPPTLLDLASRWPGRLEVIPRYDQRDLPAILAEHDAGLFTSAVEGWGLSLAEMLEGGLPVFATEAGAVPDLKRYFPRQLREFPPPRTWSILDVDDLDQSGYSARFNWPAIASTYEQILNTIVR